MNSTWFARNQVKFQNKVFNESDLVDNIKQKVGDWVKCYEKKYPYRSFFVHENLQARLRWKKSKKIHIT